MKNTSIGLRQTLPVAFLLVLSILCLAPAARAATQIDIVGPAGSGSFGEKIYILANGNIVVTDPDFDAEGPITDIGAVYLFDGATRLLIGAMSGAVEGDHVGSGGIVELNNSNFLVLSPQWGSSRGAVTWANGTTGFLQVVSIANSLVGTTSQDRVGAFGVTILTNGNYVVPSPDWGPLDVGAATWGNGSTGVSGAVSVVNSLVGSNSFDEVGRKGVVALTNGNYVVNSPLWGTSDVGAVTWGNGVTGTMGIVSASNSLVGSTANDRIGGGTIEFLGQDILSAHNGVTRLTNGNYVVSSPDWGQSNFGAVTWANGATGRSGMVSGANSLVGSNVDDRVGGGLTLGAGGTEFGGVTALTNGNYVVSSPTWHASDLGAVTWGNGDTGIVTTVSAANSLVGSFANDLVGGGMLTPNVADGGITILTNGAYLVRSPEWTATDTGAVTWGNGLTAITGSVSQANSLVGSTGGDRLGSSFTGGVTPLTNGNYVVVCELCGPTSAGAVTWGNGDTGVTGIPSVSNSLVGSTTDDRVGSGGVAPLTNGNYVVVSEVWGVTDVGAVTWGNGNAGITGLISSSNSLLGAINEDYAGDGGVTALSNGHYVVLSRSWGQPTGQGSGVGAVTWGDGAMGSAGVIAANNSLTGMLSNDLGTSTVTALINGNYVVASPSWGAGNVGAITWVNGATSFSGVISAANSLFGSTPCGDMGLTCDNVGIGGITPLGNGDYLGYSPLWDRGPIVDAGAVSYGLGNGGTVGPITAGNSVRGTSTGDGPAMVFEFDPVNDQLVVGRPRSNAVTLYRATGTPFPSPSATSTPTATNTATSTPTATPTFTPTPDPGGATDFDYDGDGRADVSVYRPSEGSWYLQRSQDGFFGLNFGTMTDRIAPADYDGDGKTDIAVYRPSEGFWYVVNSSDGSVSYYGFGVSEDLPTPADYDGDGKADISVFRPSTGTWYRMNSSDGSFAAVQFGQPGDVPTIGDFDGDGKNDVAVFRPPTGAWYQLNSSDGSFFGEQFGNATDKIAQADHDGDGKTDIAIYRPSEGLWYYKNSGSGTYTPYLFGLAADIPVAADYDGDGKADIAVFRPSDGNWYIVNSGDGSFTAVPWGQNGDLPTEGAFGN